MAAKKKTGGEAKAKQAELMLPASMDLAMAEELSESLKKVLKKKSKTFRLNFSDVLRLTTPCVQVLLAFSVQMEAAGRSLKAECISEEITAVFYDLGLKSVVDQWSESDV